MRDHLPTKAAAPCAPRLARPAPAHHMKGCEVSPTSTGRKRRVAECSTGSRQGSRLSEVEDMICMFFDPHHRLDDCEGVIPSAVRAATMALNGRQLALDDAVERIQSAANAWAEVVVEHDCIALEINRDGEIHLGLRVIRFRPLDSDDTHARANAPDTESAAS